MTVIRLATPPDLTAVRELLGIALHDTIDPTSPALKIFKKRGGRVAVPFGQSLIHVTETAGNVTGLIHTAPPVVWLQSLPHALTQILQGRVQQIEALAVAPEHRRTGTATRLIDTAEKLLRKQRGIFNFAKVRADDPAALAFYTRVGYTLLTDQRPLVFDTKAGPLDLAKLDDGYHVAVKAVQPGTTIGETKYCYYLTPA
ncbi:GNAT family N-acetyltransferase [Streptomyces noursei]